jgi:hypothetical protein
VIAFCTWKVSLPGYKILTSYFLEHHKYATPLFVAKALLSNKRLNVEQIFLLFSYSSYKILLTCSLIILVLITSSNLSACSLSFIYIQSWLQFRLCVRTSVERNPHCQFRVLTGARLHQPVLTLLTISCPTDLVLG